MISMTPALCIVGANGPSLYGLTPRERLQRQFERAGVSTVLSPEAAAVHGGPVIVVRAAAVIDQPLIAALIATPQLLLLGDGPKGEVALAAHVQPPGVPAACQALANGAPGSAGLALNAKTASELDVKFWKALRKRETPYALLVDESNAPTVEWRMFIGTYKGATDLVTKHLWPVPAYHATRLLAPLGITPNLVTTVGAVLMVLAFWLFLRGDFALGLVSAWAMTFLDTVDGKLARTTLASSKWGDVFDHGIDLVHPPFWYAAWGLGLSKVGLAWPPVTFWWVIAAILGGYIVQRIMEGIAIKWLGLEIHIWRPIDTLFRQITARRNPNLVLMTLGVLVARPDWGLMAVAIWTLACLVLHGFQLIQALAARRGGPLASWMTGK